MIIVRDIIDRIHSALGTNDRAVVFERLSDAVEALANKSDWSPLVGYLDVCVTDRCVVLPREVETVLGLNIGGTPTYARDKWFEFHLNGPGSECDGPSGFRWDDRGLVPVVRNPETPARLYAVLQEGSDENVPLRVFGYDADGLWIRSKEGGTWRDGFLVPTLADFVVPDASAPLVSRVTRIQKGASNGHIKLLAHDDSEGGQPLLIGHYQADETDPQYRQIRLPGHASWVRVLFRKHNTPVRHLDDSIPLHSRLAVILMTKALHYYETDRFIEARQYEAAAVKYLEEEQRTSNILSSTGPQIMGLSQRIFDEHLD